MRVISGVLGGRVFEAPPGHKTHPMSEKMRGALFNMLGDITGLKVLDAYSGSGAIAIEAISRGAGSVTAVESDIKAINTIKTNVATFGINIKITHANISSWINNNLNLKFDIIVADPPYGEVKIQQLEKLNRILDTDGILVLSLPPQFQKLEIKKCTLITSKNYGDSTLVFFKRLI